MTAGFDGVDHSFLCRIRELERGSARVEDHDSGVPLAFERREFGQPERLTVEADRLVEVVCFDDESELSDGVCFGIGFHPTNRMAPPANLQTSHSRHRDETSPRHDHRMAAPLQGFSIGVASRLGAGEQLRLLTALGATSLHGPMFDGRSLLAEGARVAAYRRWLLGPRSSAARGLVTALAEDRLDALVFSTEEDVWGLLAIAERMELLDRTHRMTQSTVRLFCLDASIAEAVDAAGFGVAAFPNTPRVPDLVDLISAQLERSATHVQAGDLSVALRGRELRLGADDPELLSRKERRLLAILASRPGAIFPIHRLAAAVFAEGRDDQAVAATIARLRHRFGESADAIEGVVRGGYRLVPAA